jgi:hypothetical protein|tara:strand:+ start:2683 stop:2856 length:174 start_codon:yes stop_codon:yes gene_type:complete
MGILKNQLNSVLGLKGENQPIRDAAKSTSTVHKNDKEDYSAFDLNAITPEKYTNPEG